MMKPKVIGIGFHKTGTSTLGSCLQALGYNHLGLSAEAFILYQEKELQALLKIMRYFDSFEDWPWPLVYKEAYNVFPDAKFVLTVRKNEEVWYSSLTRHIDRGDGDGFKFRKFIYGHENPKDNKPLHIEKYLTHNQAVRDFFADKPGRLLEVCWEKGDGWKELSGFINVPVPNIPFPHSNRDPKKTPLKAVRKFVRRSRSRGRALLRGA